MRRLKFLLRPGWLVLAAVVGLFAYLCFTVLAPWQLGKNTKTEHRNDLISNSINAETVPIGDVIADSTIAPDDEWRNITAAGTYLPDADILVRLQSIEGAPSYEILTPFRLDDGRTILVNRGYVRPINGAEAPPIAVPPTDPVTLNGRVRLSEGTAPGRVPMFEDGAKQVYSIDARPIGEFIGTDLIDAYIQLEPDQPGGLGTIPLPNSMQAPTSRTGSSGWRSASWRRSDWPTSFARSGANVARRRQLKQLSTVSQRTTPLPRRPRKRRCPRLPHPPPNRLVPSAVARSRSRNQCR